MDIDKLLFFIFFATWGVLSTCNLIDSFRTIEKAKKSLAENDRKMKQIIENQRAQLEYQCLQEYELNRVQKGGPID